MLRIASYTFGCKLNQSETENALSILENYGYQLVGWNEGADVFIINTCTVTSKSEQKARRLIRLVAREAPESLIVVAGCYAVVERQKLEALAPRVCAIADQPSKLCQILQSEAPMASTDEMLILLREKLDGGDRQLEIRKPRSIDFAFQPPKKTRYQRYFLKIQDGCNRQCSFCRIRIARGPSRSLAMPELIQRLQSLEEEGYQEVIITGVHINSYTYQDETGRNYYLGDLLLELLGATRNIRLRLSSLEPERLGTSASLEALLRAIQSPRICPHFHISLQSGSTNVLRQMRRIYNAQIVYDYVRKLRELRAEEDPFFSCDLIVGFPGEAEEDFAESMRLLEELEFSSVHAFSFSPRPDTEAAAMQAKVPEYLIKQRMQKLAGLTKELQHRYMQRQEGRRSSLILEECINDKWQGYTENYLKTELLLPSGSTASDFSQGQILGVRLQYRPSQANGDASDELLLYGEPLPDWA